MTKAEEQIKKYMQIIREFFLNNNAVNNGKNVKGKENQKCQNKDC